MSNFPRLLLAGGQTLIRGLDTEACRAVPKADRLAEVRCPDVAGRDPRGWLLMVMRRSGGGTIPVGDRDPEGNLWAWCKCGAEHPLSWDRLDAAWHAARDSRSARPVQITPAEVAPVS